MNNPSTAVYRAGTRVFLDYAFGGKPKGIVTRVIAPGTGFRSVDGRIAVQLLDKWADLLPGRVVEVSAYLAVPLPQEIPLKAGQFYRRINTNYRYET